MQVAASAADPGLDAKEVARFARCQCFVILEPQDIDPQFVDNSEAQAARAV